MTGLGVLSWIAGALQLVVPSYAFRLVRRFGTSRAGWFVVAAFVSLAAMHLLAPWKTVGASHASGFTLNALYLVGSVLLLIGMGHMETMLGERDRAQWTEQSLRRKWESKLKAETAELLSSREELLQELARREEAIKALQESEAYYRFLFVENPQPMWVMDLRSCRFLAVNQAALRQYGFESREFTALTGRDLVLPAGVARFLQDAAKPCSGVETRGTWQHCKKDGTLIEVEITVTDLSYGGMPARLVLATDMTLHRRHELKSRKAHRVEVISQIAGGISQYFSNVFPLIESNVSALLARPLDPEGTGQLEQINAAVTRAAGLTRQLLAAGGRQLLRLEPVDLNSLVRNLNHMLRRLLGDRIALETTYAAHLPPILADRHMVEHVIVNLVLNAREAMPGGGTVAISTEKIRIDAARAECDPEAKAGDFIRLQLRDTGCGMTPWEKSRAFEPFFTTRDPGKGMGLGLASIYGIVNQHSGWIELSSEAGVGTEFKVFLPCAPGTFSVPGTESESAATFTKGSILLVEPDDRKRALARFVLNRHGYRVIEADGSETAMVLWAGQASSVDLLLTDAELAGSLSGRELAARFRQTRPGLKVIYSAEQNRKSEGEALAQMEGAKVISKPYKPDALLQAVSSCLA